jgi:hypothetical protein
MLPPMLGLSHLGGYKLACEMRKIWFKEDRRGTDNRTFTLSNATIPEFDCAWISGTVRNLGLLRGEESEKRGKGSKGGKETAS